jgi:hypothetical protein
MRVVPRPVSYLSRRPERSVSGAGQSVRRDAWNFFRHDHACSRAYRWGEDGLAGFSDDKQQRCFALALWNSRDPILKRLFGLTNSEGNHGEDVKELLLLPLQVPPGSVSLFRPGGDQQAAQPRRLRIRAARHRRLRGEPHSPLRSVLGLEPVSPAVLGALAVITVGYVAATEIAKWAFLPIERRSFRRSE